MWTSTLGAQTCACDQCALVFSLTFYRPLLDRVPRTRGVLEQGDIVWGCACYCSWVDVLGILAIDTNSDRAPSNGTHDMTLQLPCVFTAGADGNAQTHANVIGVASPEHCKSLDPCHKSCPTTPAAQVLRRKVAPLGHASAPPADLPLMPDSAIHLDCRSRFGKRSRNPSDWVAEVWRWCMAEVRLRSRTQAIEIGMCTEMHASEWRA